MQVQYYSNLESNYVGHWKEKKLCQEEMGNPPIFLLKVKRRSILCELVEGAIQFCAALKLSGEDNLFPWRLTSTQIQVLIMFVCFCFSFVFILSDAFELIQNHAFMFTPNLCFFTCRKWLHAWRTNDNFLVQLVLGNKWGMASTKHTKCQCPFVLSCDRYCFLVVFQLALCTAVGVTGQSQ